VSKRYGPAWFGEFRLPSGPQVLKEPWPRLNSGFGQDSQESCPQIQRRAAIPVDNVDRYLFSLLECLDQSPFFLLEQAGN
jgi:hypothetical protein